MKVFGQQVKKELKETGRTQKEFAVWFGVSTDDLLGLREYD